MVEIKSDSIVFVIENEEFTIFYQPLNKVIYRTGAVASILFNEIEKEALNNKTKNSHPELYDSLQKELDLFLPFYKLALDKYYKFCVFL